jgi:hypothetical protein
MSAGEVARLHNLFSVRKQYVFALKTLLAPTNAPFDVEIDLHRPQLQTYLAVLFWPGHEQK